MAKTTRMQQKIYDYIAQALREQGIPSVREIGEAVGTEIAVHSAFPPEAYGGAGVRPRGPARPGPDAGAAHAGGRCLTARRYRRRRHRRRTASPWWAACAGSPILAEECIEDYLTFDTGGREGSTFALRVRGESMLNAGILPDDLVVVHRQPTAHNGEIVVALLGTRPR